MLDEAIVRSDSENEQNEQAQNIVEEIKNTKIKKKTEKVHYQSASPLTYISAIDLCVLCLFVVPDPESR